MQKTETGTFCPASRLEWRTWLKKNHRSTAAVWLIYHKKKSDIPSLSWSEAVDEALCFGWIDSTKKTIDSDTFMQFFTKRKATSTWSKINKDKVQQLIEAGLMTKAGYESIEKARQNNTWSALDHVEDLTIPKDLEKTFKSHKGSKDFFEGLSKSVRKGMLQWVVVAKRPETRQKRIDEIASLAGKKQKPKQF